MKRIKSTIISAVILLSLCSCNSEEVIETMIYNDMPFGEYQENTEPVTEPETYGFPEIPDISEALQTESAEKTPVTTAVDTTATQTTAVSVSLTESTVKTDVTATVAVKEDFINIDVPYISQSEDYPTGCELVSASMLLNFYGFDITAGELIDEGYMESVELEYSTDGKNTVYCGNPEKVFIGNPRNESGYGCYAPALLECLKKYLDGKYFDAVNLSEISLKDLCAEYIDFGEPVIIWASLDMNPTVVNQEEWTIKETGEKFNWISNEHCMVLVGYDESYYYFNDPQNDKAVPYKKETAEKRYKELGSQAVTVRPW